MEAWARRITAVLLAFAALVSENSLAQEVRNVRCCRTMMRLVRNARQALTDYELYL